MNDNVFIRPTVEKVIFRIDYPNLFYLERKIPDIQMDILSEFPESALMIKQQLPIVKIDKINSPNDSNDDILVQNIWEFKNTKGYILQISSNNFSIQSTMHKTYNSKNSDIKFRDTIKLCLDVFGKYTKLPFIKRVGLRYSDKCPLIKNTSKDYEESFESSFSLSKISIENTESAYNKVVKKIGKYGVVCQESYNAKEPNWVKLDFDGFANEVKYEDCLLVTDEIHDIISEEYFNTIKKPIIDWMEGK